MTATGKHVIIIVNFILIASFLSRFYFDRVLSDLNESIKVKSEIIKQNSSFEADYKTLQNKIEDIKKITSAQNRPIQIISELASLLPPGINLNSFALNNKEATFQARIDSEDSLTIFLSNLNSSKIIENVTIESIEKQNVKDQIMNASFKIIII